MLCRLGRGTGLLSGAHFEFDPDMLASQIDVHNSPQTQQILPFLIEFNASRQKLCSYLLDTLLSCGPDELACLQGHGTMVSSTLASSS
ncbi:unnamed protein product [Protopolystoma xenopodis]|uniref:Uncharacterized protein n=1 Tax=Protopolystoma xenopodis TaxID=117903 RepID=A0A3S5APD7_9PLAT|nr:unnamed protein product [Protopolystoma xenopodis]